jgi:alpha-glucosidase (family GH31 glycosyl hydrolase)
MASMQVTRGTLALSWLVLTMLAGCGGDDDAPTDAGTDARCQDCTVDGGTRACTFEPGAPEALPEPAIHTPRWAFEPWISKDISDRDDTFAFVEGFRSRDIPVGVVVLDSPWETHYNTFVPNPTRYGDFPAMVESLHAMDVRIVLWVTQMVNSSAFDLETGGDTYVGPSPNYGEGRACGFYVDDGAEYGWWKGAGSGVDFFDEGARQWWHRQQDPLLEIGVDGWKLDFGEEYIRRTMVTTEEGPKTRQEYSEAYYRDFYAYGQAVRGRDFVTMVRPYDQSYGAEGRFFARPEHAPVGWVGDNHRDFSGLVDALDHLFRSAAAGYVVIGSDIGGYLDRDELDLTREIPFDLEVFHRWTALGALTPFMELHGRQNLEPWNVPGDVAGETVAIYRYWSKLHSELVPFFYSLAEEAYAGRATPIMRPVGADPEAWAGDYRFFLGDAFLVAPVIAAGGARDIALPAGRYYDYWDPAGDAIDGDTTLTAYDLGDASRIGLFVREGAIVPMNVRDDATGHGTAASAGSLTVLVWPGAVETTFALHDTDDATTSITASSGAGVTVSRALVTTLVRIRTGSAPASVSVGGAAVTMYADRAAFDAASGGAYYEAETRSVWVKLPSSSAPSTVTWD